MGLGKTVITLTAFRELQDRALVGRMLVIAPLRVCQTVWRQEAKRWGHLQDLRFSLIHGTPTQRHRAFRVPADVYLINYENLRWLSEQMQGLYLKRGKYMPFSSMVVYDEVSRLKHHTTKRHRALRKLLPYFRRRVGLTGTPASNGYDNLFGQFLAIDSGQRLGQSITAFRDRYMYFDGYGHFGRHRCRPGAEQQIHDQIEDITLQMDSADYLELPEILINDVDVPIVGELRTKYEQLEREMFLELDTVNIEVFYAAALSMKCRQFTNGAMYLQSDSPEWVHVHDLKLDALAEVIEEAAGKPVLVAYLFKHDAERIQKRFPEAEILGSHLSTAKTIDLEQRWNLGEVPLLLGHPQSMGHGLNLQQGPCTDLVFFGLDWSLENYEQVIARLVRQGQRNNIRVHRLLSEDTVDRLVAMSLNDKGQTQDGLKAAMNEYRRQKGVTRSTAPAHHKVLAPRSRQSAPPPLPGSG